MPVLRTGFRGRKRQEIKENQAKKQIPISGSDVPVGLLRSGMWDVRDMRKYGRMCEAPLFKKGKGDSGWDLSIFSR